MYKYALVLDNLFSHEFNYKLLASLDKANRDVTLFVLDKQNIIHNLYPVFNVCDLWNWRGITIASSLTTLKLVKKYPIPPPVIFIGNIKLIENTENNSCDFVIPELDFLKIETFLSNHPLYKELNNDRR